MQIDLVTDLPEDVGSSTVMTVVDKFSKMCSFVPLSSTTAASIATTFFKIVVHYVLPRKIIGNYDSHFTSEFWHCLKSVLKTNLYFSTAFHPQTDGMAEVSNRTLGQLLCINCKDERWVKTLPLLVLLYNSIP